MTSSILNAAELDMIWRVALAEFFTSPTKPSGRTQQQNASILVSLARRGYVTDRHPVRLTELGRSKLTKEQRDELDVMLKRRVAIRSRAEKPGS